jgi:hypothetical protein
MTEQAQEAAAPAAEVPATPAPSGNVLASLAGGAIQVVESAGVISLVIADSASIGGGDAKGILKIEGSAKVTFDALTGVKLGEALLNEHLPPAVEPLAAVVEGIVNQAVSVILK